MLFPFKFGSLFASLLVSFLLAGSVCPLRVDPSSFPFGGPEDGGMSGPIATGSGSGTGSNTGNGAGSRFYRFITDAGSVVEIENRPLLPSLSLEPDRIPPFANARLLNAYLGPSSPQSQGQSQSQMSSLPSQSSQSSQLSSSSEQSTSGLALEHALPGVNQLVPVPSNAGSLSPKHRIVTRGGGKQRFCGEMLVSALALVCKGNYRKRTPTPELADCKCTK